MTLFDLVFIVVVVATLGMVLAALVSAFRRRGKRAWKWTGRLALLLGSYLSAVLVVSIASPGRVVAIGEEQCWDDWCVSVASVRRHQTVNGVSLEVTLRMRNSARRTSQSAPAGSGAYVLDDRGRRFNAEPVPPDSRLVVRLGPEEIRDVIREFRLPADAHAPVLVVTHGGRFPGAIIIGDSVSLFHKPTVVPLEGAAR